MVDNSLVDRMNTLKMDQHTSTLAGPMELHRINLKSTGQFIDGPSVGHLIEPPVNRDHFMSLVFVRTLRP